jgi:hypothetical protein
VIGMQPTFVIPTYRLKEVRDTVMAYDENFRKNGHRIKMTVFDDSPVSMHEKYISELKSLKTYCPLHYVGPYEKELFIKKIIDRIKDKKLSSIVKNLFRPSYGGNRNVALIYTLGELVISADDDMRPHALIANGSPSLTEREISRGYLMKKTSTEYHRVEFDIVRSFSDCLARKVKDLPENFVIGDHIIDSAMELETNTSKGLTRENHLIIKEGGVDPDAEVKIVQTFRSGTNDLDALDFLEMFLMDSSQHSIDDINDQYVLGNFRPAVTLKNWRFDCGVSGLDNRVGLPPYFPTRLRFEDYIYRLWLMRGDVISAHIDCAQHHMKSNYMRSPLAADIFNEQLCGFLKNKIKDSVGRIHDYGIEFGFDGAITGAEVSAILERILEFKSKVDDAIRQAADGDRKKSLQEFAGNLAQAFYGYDADFFEQNISRILDDVISQIKGGLELWQTLVEIAMLMSKRGELPLTKFS